VVGGGGDSCRPTVHLGATCLQRRREKIADLATLIGPREPRSPPPHHHTDPTSLSAAPHPTCVPETAHPAASVRPIACRSGHRPLGTSAAPRSSPAGGQKGKARRGRWGQQTPESQHDPPSKAPSTCDISRKAHRTGPDAAAVGVPITSPRADATARVSGAHSAAVARVPLPPHTWSAAARNSHAGEGT
jgi:hypothetical protein